MKKTKVTWEEMDRVIGFGKRESVKRRKGPQQQTER